jgi:hypothetical protein
MEEQYTWADFGGEWLKAIEVLNDKEEYVITGQELSQEKGKNVLVLELERNGKKKKFGCNKTNLLTVQKECPLNPKQAIGRVVTFTKVQVNNPITQQIVDGLRIHFKEKK